MLVKSMNFVLVLIKWKARIDFWKSLMETWHRFSRRDQHAGESWIAHDNGNKSAFRGFFFFGLQFPSLKVTNFWHCHTARTHSQRKPMHSPPPIESDSMACSFEVQQEYRPFGQFKSNCLSTPLGNSEEYLPLKSAGLAGQPQTHRRVGRHQKVLHGASQKPDWRGWFWITKLRAAPETFSRKHHCQLQMELLLPNQERVS